LSVFLLILLLSSCGTQKETGSDVQPDSAESISVLKSDEAPNRYDIWGYNAVYLALDIEEEGYELHFVSAEAMAAVSKRNKGTAVWDEDAQTLALTAVIGDEKDLSTLEGPTLRYCYHLDSKTIEDYYLGSWENSQVEVSDEQMAQITEQFLAIIQNAASLIKN